MAMDKQPNSRSCFLCGRENPISLKVSWYNDPENRQVRATVTVPDDFNSYPGIVHGGVVAALLDETAGRAVMLDGDWSNLMVTLKLEVTYRRTTPTGTPLEVVGWVVRGGHRRAQVAGEVRLPDGTVTARCEALIVRPPEDVLAGWEAERAHWRVYDD